MLILQSESEEAAKTPREVDGVGGALTVVAVGSD
jgi:hypothetical protein